MTIENLQLELKKHHQRFIKHIDALSENEFVFSNNDKWTAGQELDHIIKSVFPISQLLANKAFIESKFGFIDRATFNYEELINKYQEELKKGGQAMGQFIPNKVNWIEKESLTSQLTQAIDHILKHLTEYTQKELNQLVIPHPLIGKLTIKEMIFFTVYHVQHHLENSLKNLKTA